MAGIDALLSTSQFLYLLWSICNLLGARAILNWYSWKQTKPWMHMHIAFKSFRSLTDKFGQMYFDRNIWPFFLFKKLCIYRLFCLWLASSSKVFWVLLDVSVYLHHFFEQDKWWYVMIKSQEWQVLWNGEYLIYFLIWCSLLLSHNIATCFVISKTFLISD
jgi:hypothetical protein